MLIARDESMYQREQSQSGGHGGAQRLEVRQMRGYSMGARRSRTDADANNINSRDILT